MVLFSAILLFIVMKSSLAKMLAKGWKAKMGNPKWIKYSCGIPMAEDYSNWNAWFRI